VFIAFGAVPLLAAMVYGLMHLRRTGTYAPLETEVVESRFERVGENVHGD
jgi:hypothetical protein